jgi:hypothetical protein
MSEPFEPITRYVGELRSKLEGMDSAIVHDAVADAEDHLRAALDQALSADPLADPKSAWQGIEAKFGTPEEVARAYREMEKPSRLPFREAILHEARSPLQRFVGVLADPRAYGALFFMLFSLITGILYFTWAVTGMSLSLGLMVLIIGLPFFGLFLFSIQGLALVEGRLIEALLGIRMPRRGPSAPAAKGIWKKFTARVTDRRTWTTLFYLVLKLPLGVLSFSVFLVLVVYALQLMFLPFLQLVLDAPLIVTDNVRIVLPIWATWTLAVAGFLDMIVVLHLARWMGRGYGAMAKAMLVKA